MVVSTRRTVSPAFSKVLGQADKELELTAQALEPAPGAAAQQSSRRDGPAHRTPLVYLQRVGFLALLLYLTWALLILGGVLAYEGEPIRVKSRDLPLHFFDIIFRTAGSLLLFGLWAVRAAATHLLPAHFDRRANLVWVPAGIYAAQAVIRLVIYQLHVAGYIFTPQRWARDGQSHPPHVMSDHILLAAAVHGGLASEALLPLLNWQHTGATGRGRAFLRLYPAAAGLLAMLVSAECYFTARYFHPPSEILLAAALGLALFQAPLLWYATRAFQAHHAQLQPQLADSSSAAKRGEHARSRRQR